MSRAFDTINRKKLTNHLQEKLTNDEMRLTYLLISDVKLNVRLGVAQGDCLSAIPFIFHQAKSVKPSSIPKERIMEDGIMWSASD